MSKRKITGGDRITVTTARGDYEADIVSANDKGCAFRVDGDERTHQAAYLEGGAELAKAYIAWKAAQR